jgi:outer membrane receptor for ferrienterochelin and colicin
MIMFDQYCHCFVAVLLVLGLSLSPANLAFGQGTIEGEVSNAETGEPLPGVNVVIEELGRGSAADSEGRYVIEGVPAGTHEITARFVGFQSQTKEVMVSEGETTVVNFRLEEEAIGLDEVVVTGAAGRTQRREMGASISSVDVGELALSSSPSMEDLLAGASPGMDLNIGEGMSGSGAQIRLRGNSSISQVNAPLVYIDGLRIRSTGFPKAVPPVGYSGRSNNTTANPINDIDPSTIDRVEIVKGAAATTLYGTEAAPGVIQVFTKEGTERKAQWSFRVRQGFQNMQEFGPSNTPFYRMDPFLKRGHQQKYSGSVIGGNQGINYFLSTSYTDNVGVLPDDNQQKFTTRANIGFNPAEFLNIDFNTYYVNDDVQNPPAGNNAQGLTLNALRGEANYLGTTEPSEIRKTLDTSIKTSRDHFVIGGTANYSPVEPLNSRLRVGLDRADMELRTFRPRGFLFAPEGKMSNRNWVSNTITLDFVTNYDFEISSDLSSRISVGGQRIQEITNEVVGYAENFSSPGEPVLSDGGSTLSFEDRIEKITAGGFIQGVLRYLDRYFLTVGFRLDGNSAFGDDFGLQPYPQASLSYVVSEESFWNDDWGTFRLRGAYGHAGQAPGTFDAVRTWENAPWGDQSAFLPGNVGDPSLGPERTVETEGGFELTTLSDRLTIDFNYYRQITKDALLPVTQIPSKGFEGSQLRNAGELKNSGIEFSVQSTLYESGEWTFDLGGSVATNQSEVLDLGDAPPFTVSGGGWIEEGEPFPAIRGRRVLNEEEVADPEYLRDENGDIAFDVYGPNNPTHTFTLEPTITFPYGIQLTSRFQYKGGHYMTDGASSNVAFRQNAPMCQSFYENPGQTTALERARCDVDELSKPFNSWVYPADVLKLRSATLRTPLPFAQSVAQSASFSLSVNNIRLWLNDDFWAFDPEMTGQEGLNQVTRSITEHIPAPYSVRASIDITL